MVISIDNGVTGWITILTSDGGVKHYSPVPTKKDLNYTKTKQWINRIDVVALSDIIKKNIIEGDNIIAVLERPMVNPGRFKATTSALRCLEAELIVLEMLKIPYVFLDSKEWQREMLPEGVKKEELKIASDTLAKRLFPELSEKIKRGGGDSLLMAKYWIKKQTYKEN